MNNNSQNGGGSRFAPYLSILGIWALAFGCSVGQGAFVMPGNTFLPLAGPIGTVIGVVLGALVMILLAKNYHILMNRYPDSGGTYTYIKKCFGYDHGFLSAWFLILTYIAILWANATALPIVARMLLGSTFRFGFHYEIAGFHIYFGEILLAVAGLAVGALICLRNRLAKNAQILMGVVLLGFVIFVFTVAMIRRDAAVPLFDPPFSNDSTPVVGVFTMFALAPWAYAGFESVSHSAAEVRFPLKKTFRILVVALITAAIAYALLALLAVTALPEGVSDWTEYVANLDSYGGRASQPTFFAAESALGSLGTVLLGVAALFGIFTGLVGNYIALSRLVASLSADQLMPAWIGKLDKHRIPRRAILCVFGVSIVIPFFGRTAISWIVDVTTVGATIAYALTSAAAIKTARSEKSRSGLFFGIAGLAVSLFFAFAFLIPNLISVKTLATESYLILAAWGLFGFLIFLYLLRKDKHRRIGRSNVALIVMLGLIIFTSTVWMQQSSDQSISRSVDTIESYHSGQIEKAAAGEATDDAQKTDGFVRATLGGVDTSLGIATTIQIALIVLTLAVLFLIYARIQKREKQIEVEKALAEESSRAKTSFLSNMSHEIRTPMNAIIGLDNIALRDPDLHPKTRENLEKIGASAKHLLGLINDILDMSRIESGRMVLKTDEFSFWEFIDQVNIIINGQCMDKGLRYECVIVGQIDDYYIGDDMKLKQVLINILGNAVKFTPAPGEVTLTIEQNEKRDGRCILHFSMKDTGIGMDKEFLQKIFEAFSQEDATTTNRYGGSGLGMAITKNFVEMMGGQITVESEKGVGSVFDVTVSLGESSRTYRAENGRTLPADMRAVVIEDDETACEHAKIVLGALGVKAETFTNARRALSAIRSAYDAGKPFDLLLIDYKMPIIDGRELCRSVRAFDENKTAVVMLTGYNCDIIEDEALADGVDTIIAKPLFPDSLLHAVSGVLDKKNGTAPDAGSADTAQTVQTHLAGLRMLMAEDVDANAEILADLLDLEEIGSERASNGEEAVRMFADSPVGYFDAILMDVRMPVMDGLSATRAIRALDREDAKSVPIIAMTANVFDEDVQRSLDAGMNAHLSKPIEPDLLYATMAELVGGRQEARQ